MKIHILTAYSVAGLLADALYVTASMFQSGSV